MNDHGAVVNVMKIICILAIWISFYLMSTNNLFMEWISVNFHTLEKKVAEPGDRVKKGFSLELLHVHKCSSPLNSLYSYQFS